MFKVLDACCTHNVHPFYLIHFIFDNKYRKGFSLQFNAWCEILECQVLVSERPTVLRPLRPLSESAMSTKKQVTEGVMKLTKLRYTGIHILELGI